MARHSAGPLSFTQSTADGPHRDRDGSNDSNRCPSAANVWFLTRFRMSGLGRRRSAAARGPCATVGRPGNQEGVYASEIEGAGGQTVLEPHPGWWRAREDAGSRWKACIQPLAGALTALRSWGQRPGTVPGRCYLHNRLRTSCLRHSGPLRRDLAHVALAGW